MIIFNIDSLTNPLYIELTESWFYSDFFGLISWTILMFLNPLLLLSQDDPVVLVIVLVAVSLEKIFEHVLHGSVLRSFIESQVSALTQILDELNRVALAEDLDRGGQLLFFDPFILVSLIVGLESLPRKHSSQEVHCDITNTLHIVSTC